MKTMNNCFVGGGLFFVGWIGGFFEMVGRGGIGGIGGKQERKSVNSRNEILNIFFVE